MKHLILLISLLFSQLTWSQNFYASVSGGFQIVHQSKQPASFVIHTHHSISLPYFYNRQHLAFKQVSNVDMNLGYMLNNKLGFEVSMGYLKPLDNVLEDDFALRTLSGNFWRLNPKFVLNIDKGKWSFNTKLGFIWSRGSMNYSQGSQEEIAINYRYYGGESLGFNGSLGIERKMSDRFSLFAELRRVSQSYSPKRGLMTNYSIGGQDLLELYDLSTYQLEIEFSDSEELSISPNDGDESQPQKLYSRNFSLGGYGINLGVKFVLWRK